MGGLARTLHMQCSPSENRVHDFALEKTYSKSFYSCIHMQAHVLGAHGALRVLSALMFAFVLRARKTSGHGYFSAVYNRFVCVCFALLSRTLVHPSWTTC